MGVVCLPGYHGANSVAMDPAGVTWGQNQNSVGTQSTTKYLLVKQKEQQVGNTSIFNSKKGNASSLISTKLSITLYDVLLRATVEALLVLELL